MIPGIARVVSASGGAAVAIGLLAASRLDERVAWWLKNAHVGCFRWLEFLFLAVGYALVLLVRGSRSVLSLLGLGCVTGYLASVAAYLALPFAEGRSTALTSVPGLSWMLIFLLLANPILVLGWLVGPVGLATASRVSKWLACIR